MSLPANITSCCLPTRLKGARIHLRGAGKRQGLCGITPGTTTEWVDVTGKPDCPFCIESLASRTRAAERRAAKEAMPAPKVQKRIADLPGLYIVTRKVFPPGVNPKNPTAKPLWDWTSPALAGTKAGLEKFFAHPNATTEAKHVGAL